MYFSVTTYRNKDTGCMESHVHGVSSSYTRAKTLFDKRLALNNSTVTLWELESENGGNAYLLEQKEGK